jgi:serine/threonine-protein kinase
VSDLPERLGPYDIRREIGAGGMGVVYLGWDAQLCRQVAVKTLRPEMASDESARRLFLREARAVAAISHPHVTQIYYIGEEDGAVFFAMEYLEGKSLREMLRDHGVPSPEGAVDLVRQAALGLKAAADRGIIHRDVKPSNLMLAGDGTLKVTDFGLAKQTVADTGLTASTVLIGTPDYLSPELASGEAADLRSDIYSLGATLYELLTGRPPFEGPTPLSVVMKHVRESVPPPRGLRSEVSHPLSSFTVQMMAKRPGNRPQSYEVLLKQLARLREVARGAPATDAPPSPVIPPNEDPASSKGSWKGRMVVGMLALFVLLAGWKLVSRQTSATVPNVAGTPVDAPTGPADAAPSPLPASGTPPATPRFAPPPPLERRRAQLTVVENTSEITPEGKLRVLGEVKNVGEGRAASGKIRITLLDEQGQALDFTEVPLAPAVIDPGAFASFDAVLPGEARHGMIQLELKWVS